MTDAEVRLRSLADDEWGWRLGELPDLLWHDAASPIPERLVRVDSPSQAARRSRWESVATELATIDPVALSGRSRLDLEVYRHQIATLLDQQRFRDFEMPLNADAAFWIDCANVGRRGFLAAGDRERWIAQMRDLPRYFDEQIDQMRRGLERGFTPPRITLEGRDRAIAGVVDAEPEATGFYVPFRAPAASGLREAAASVIRDEVQPAYARLLHFFRNEYLPNTRETLPAADLPDGPEYYRAKIREFTTLDLDPRDIHETGLREVERVTERMRATARETGFEGDLRSFIDQLRTDPRFIPKTGEEMMLRAAYIAKRFDAVAARFFGRIPRARMAIEPVPDDVAPFYTVGRAYPGRYLLNLYRPETRALYNLAALGLHEGEPGHVFQVALALEADGAPDFRRYSYLSAYGEGWALYAEELGVEMGIYESPYEVFGMLSGQMWRAARLVIDTGIHAFGWSREQAIEYLGTHTALPQPEVVTEVDRYISWPAQALSYYLGMLAITGARAKAERTLGDAFDVRAFHDAVLATGSVPLPALESWLDEQLGT
jgi:uncharacterized protein (DUF885 family)